MRQSINVNCDLCDMACPEGDTESVKAWHLLQRSHSTFWQIDYGNMSYNEEPRLRNANGCYQQSLQNATGCRHKCQVHCIVRVAHVGQSLLESNAKVQDNGDGTGFSMGDKANQRLQWRWRAVAKVEAVLALGIQAYSSGTSSNSNKKSTKDYCDYRFCLFACCCCPGRSIAPIPSMGRTAHTKRDEKSISVLNWKE